MARGKSLPGDYRAWMDGVGAMTEIEKENFEERAAIVEFDAGWPRPIAEAEARRLIGATRWAKAHGPERSNSLPSALTSVQSHLAC